MSYTALYRKWRPDAFEDVKGQDHIVTTLKNQIESDRVGHAYLFCGTRGTGKTTIAKIFAKAVNCEHPVNGSPCGECAVCKAIAKGSSLNVIEIDAASNNGVDNIRQIKEEVTYGPTEGKYKVYIIDEVHMLSAGAFNALLKTLEEPPEYIIFILATTEVNKLPVTIISRCQRYNFKRISVEVITARLRELVDKEGARVEEKALQYIAKLADGAMRDALSLLDRCMTLFIDKEMKYEDVLEILGSVDTEVFSTMLRNVVDGKVTELIRGLDDLILEGRDLTQFVSDFTWYLRNLLMLKASDESAKMIDMSEENLSRLKEETYLVSEEQIMRYIRILSELSNQIKFSTQKRVMTEVSLIKMTRPQMEKDMESITERLNRIEELVKEKEDIIALTAIRPEGYGAGNLVPAEARQAVKPKPTVKAVSEDIRKIIENWHGIVAQTEGCMPGYLKITRLSADNDTLILVPANDMAYKFLLEESHFSSLKGIIENTIGKEISMEVKKIEVGQNFEDTFADVESFVKLNISVED